MKILTEPSEFYAEVIKGIQNSTFRISMATLYLGTGPMEHKLLKELHQASNTKPNLKIHFVMDKFRGT